MRSLVPFDGVNVDDSTLNLVKVRLLSNASRFSGAPITERQLPTVNGLLNEKVGKQWRKPVLAMLWEVESSKDLLLGEASATIDWLLSDTFEQEWARIYRERLLQQGQTEMF